MRTAEKSLIPAVAIHPGEHLCDELDARGVSQTDFAKMIGYQKSQLNEVIKGKRGINAELALLLQSALGIEATFWLNLQKNYELDSAKIESKDRSRLEALELWSIINESIPVSFFKKNGILSGDPILDIPTIKEVYDIDNFEQLAVINASPTFAHFRKSDKQVIDRTQVVAWFKLCEFKAKGLVVNEFNQAVKTELIKSLTEIFYKNQNTITALEATLAEAGIKLILQEKGEKMPIDGVSFWSNGNPAIGLSLRYKRIDWLAFTLFHELGHVFCHLVNNNQAVMIDLDNEDPDYKKSKEEMEANEFAQNYLIDPQAWNTFYQDYSYGDSKILSFSQSQKIHPGIILGRLCHMNGNFNMRTKVDKAIY